MKAKSRVERGGGWGPAYGEPLDSLSQPMKNAKVRLVLLCRVIVTLAALGALLLVADQDLLSLISPWLLLLCASAGVLMLWGIVICFLDAGALWSLLNFDQIAGRPSECNAMQDGEPEWNRWVPLEIRPARRRWWRSEV